MSDRASFGPDLAPRLSFQNLEVSKSKRSDRTQSNKKTSEKNTSDKKNEETKSLSNSLGNTNERHSAHPFLNVDAVTKVDPDICSPNFKQS